MTRKLLLVCGILASLLYVATDMLAAIRWEGYSYTAQTISETFAIGAPTRPLEPRRDSRTLRCVSQVAMARLVCCS